MTPEEQLQADVYARLLADPALATVVILSQQLGVAESDLAQALAAVTNLRAGALKGAAIIVGMPWRKVNDPEAPGPRINVDLPVRCIERPLINRNPGGTNLTAEFLSDRVELMLHNFGISASKVWGMCTLVSDGADPVVYENKDREYQNHFKSEIYLGQLCKPAQPHLTGNAAAVTITSTVGALIYYTTDGSSPWSGNGTAVLYAEPFAVEAGTLVRACAFFVSPTPTQAPSNVAGKVIN